MTRMIRLAAIAVIALPLATATANAENVRPVKVTAATSAAPADVVVAPGWPHHHPCRGWHRFCF